MGLGRGGLEGGSWERDSERERGKGEKYYLIHYAEREGERERDRETER